MAPPSSLLLPLFLSLFLQFCRLSTSALPSLAKHASLSVENPGDVLVSPSGAFSAGFLPVGYNAYGFAVWFSDPPCSVTACTPVWMANREAPVNGRESTLSLLHSGNLVLTDAGTEVWFSGTSSASATELRLNDTGNLFLTNGEGGVLWQSFDLPIDTLLPQQPLTRNKVLISARSRNNYSTVFYKLYFGNDNVLRLLFDGPSISGVYWPYPWISSNKLDRFLYNSSRIAVLNPLGHFQSSDNYSFSTSDYGAARQRRMTLDFDGNLRVYSRERGSAVWAVTWEALSSIPCFIHGVCGNNSLYSYDPAKGRSYSCVPGYVPKVLGDWSAGCVPNFTFFDRCVANEVGFVKLLYVDFWGYDYNTILNTTLKKWLVWFFLIKNQQDVTSTHQSHLNTATGFKRFTYDELKKATRNFSKEIGRGAGGIVYKAVLPDDRVVAVKVLSNAATGEADFLAEASTIGRVNHINLIGMWGYCAEGNHRLLVYEFMERGSLAQNLLSPELHWKRRFDIAVGTAKGLAYLHEECLEWDLHCNVKPQNILLEKSQ
ncbi:hypothetical protein EUGRSUZ_B01045 [Eucalyptus grandis]|uniref:Uncharacterized protein n=2 Tax=Eucalyptus grandis TaxID=71139 RepID=A0ACC3LQZ3_EUCGR|nr:hypothetical protein EUGRSUZ_B01045 [Eucalyptus grandis]